MKLKLAYCIALSAVVLAACSSGDDSANDVPIDSQPPAEDLINALNARSFAIDMLEVNDILEFSGLLLPVTVAQTEAEANSCASQGAYSLTNTASGSSARFENCDLIDGQDIVLNGSLGIITRSGSLTSNTYAIDLDYQAFTAARNGRSVSVTGQLAVISDDSSIMFNSGSLTVNDSQGDVIFTQLSLTQGRGTSQATPRSIDYTAQFSRFLVSPVTVLAADLAGSSAACPQQGSITVTATDNTSLSISASGGQSMLLEAGETSETINCTEVSKLIVENGIVPPPPPTN